QTALENRPELKGAKAFVKARQVAEAAARNGLLPRLDLELRYGLTGRGKSHTRAWDMQNVGDFADWSMELVFELPIGNRIAKAQHARAQLETSEAAGQLELTRQTIILEVSKAVRGIETLKKQVSATGRAVEAMQKTLEGEQAKLELGVGVIRDVLEAQDDLARVERDYTFSVLNLHLSRLQLDFAKGTVLANRQVEIIHERRKDGYPEPRPRLAAK
ncbi:MAG: TolC family protein, partial [Phycisphaerae bacterium]|nr:TolC family protein [Phycisphaerae bacterium]